MIYLQGLMFLILGVIIVGFIISGYVALDAEAGARRAKKAQQAAYKAASQRK